LKKREAILPKHPDEQKLILLEGAEEDMRVPMNEENIQRYVYYLTEGIEESDLSPYEKKYIAEALKKIPAKYKQLKDYRPMIATHEKEVLQFYEQFIRKNLLHYILKDPKERKRLNIVRIPRDYPVLVVRAPVPWHNSFCVSQQLLEKHFYISNIVVLEIRDLWESKYSDMLIIPTDRLEEVGQFPLEMDVLEEQIDHICTESRNILVREWLPSCADIFLKYKMQWRKYIPLKPTDSPVLVERFFDCVNGLLSMQLRRLVMRSLRHFLSLMVKFKVS
jgi:dynein heavy chain